MKYEFDFEGTHYEANDLVRGGRLYAVDPGSGELTTSIILGSIKEAEITGRMFAECAGDISQLFKGDFDIFAGCGDTFVWARSVSVFRQPSKVKVPVVVRR